MLAFINDSLALGQSPLWNPWQQTGFPLYADPQTQLWSPIPFLLTRLGLLDWRVLQIEALAGFILAGLSAYALCRRLRVSPLPAAFGAAAWMTCGGIVGHATHLGIAWGLMLYPAVLALVLMALERSAVCWVYAGALWGIIALGAHPSILMTGTLNLVLFALLWPVSPAASTAPPSSLPRALAAHLAPRIGGLAVLGLFFLLLYAIQWVPVLYHASEFNRGSLDYSATTASHYLEPRMLITLFAPRLGISTFRKAADITMRNCYIGLLPLLMLSGLVFDRPHARRNLVLAGLAFFNLLCAMGPLTPLRGLLARFIPGFDFFQYPSANFRGFFLLGLILLAVLGFDRLLRRARERRVARAPLEWKPFMIPADITLLIIALVACGQAGVELAPRDRFALAMQLSTLLVGVVLVGALICGVRVRRWMLLAIMGLHGLDLGGNVCTNAAYLGSVDDFDKQLAIRAESEAARAEGLARTDLPPPRSRTVPADHMIVNRAILRRQGEFSIYNPGTLASFGAYIADYGKDMDFIVNVPPPAVVLPAPVADFTLGKPLPTLQAAGAAVAIVRYENARVVLAVEPTPTTHTLMLFDSYTKGWRARASSPASPQTFDVPIVPIFGAFRGMQLPPSSAPVTVELRFQPIALPIGAALTIFGLLATLVILIRHRLRAASPPPA